MFKTEGVLLSLPKAEPRGVQGMPQERSRRQVGDMSWTHTNHKMSGKHTITIKSHELKHRGQGILHVLFSSRNISLFYRDCPDYWRRFHLSTKSTKVNDL